MANAIKQTFIPVETPQNLQIVTNVQQSALQKQLVDEVPSAYPTVQPMKSYVHFEINTDHACSFLHKGIVLR